jgi:iron complex transport system permease protein
MLSVLIALLLVLSVVSLLSGRVWLNPREVLSGLFSGNDDFASLIVTELRLPRTVLAGCHRRDARHVRRGLARTSRNPLAEPGLLGVSAGTSFGAVMRFISAFRRSFRRRSRSVGAGGARP